MSIYVNHSSTDNNNTFTAVIYQNTVKKSYFSSELYRVMSLVDIGKKISLLALLAFLFLDKFTIYILFWKVYANESFVLISKIGIVQQGMLEVIYACKNIENR